ncbi:MAG TPA: energy transducer TonB, partial [Candidatus Goldiibacteriota bacterium]|nr:energy transducer TonB [Candidatus Goldiibacteriota bacterium]
ARQNGIGGKSMVAFSINRDGTVKDVRLFSSSGNDILDREAVENIMRASPFPKLPDTVKEETLALEIAISFKLN